MFLRRAKLSIFFHAYPTCLPDDQNKVNDELPQNAQSKFVPFDPNNEFEHPAVIFMSNEHYEMHEPEDAFNSADIYL